MDTYLRIQRGIRRAAWQRIKTELHILMETFCEEELESEDIFNEIDSFVTDIELLEPALKD